MRIRSTEHAVLVHDVDALGEAPASSGTGDVLLEREDPRLSPLAIAAFDADSPLARLTRSLRLSISALPLAHEPPIRSLAVLGVRASVEASILAANLAITYAQGGTPTVLVDANLDEPSQHLFFGMRAAEGLGAALAGDADVRSLVQATPVRNLAVLPGGTSAASASVLLDGQHFHRRAMPLLESYGMMIVDVGMSLDEPAALCEALDAAIIVVRQDSASTEEVRHTVSRLDDMKTRIVGSVMVR